MGCNQQFQYSHCVILAPEVDLRDTPEFPWELGGQYPKPISTDSASGTSLTQQLGST